MEDFRLGETGILDKNGKEICYGDKVQCIWYLGDLITGTVEFKKGSFGISWQRGSYQDFTPFANICNAHYEIIGE